MDSEITHAIPSSRPPRDRTRDLSGYRILARLGHGGMAEVFLAGRTTGVAVRPVVIKRLYAHNCEDPGVVQMFIDEARLALQLAHPNIVRTDEVGMLGGRHAIVMEFLEGQPLQRAMKRTLESSRPVPLDVFANIFIGALEGLHHAHEACDSVGRPLDIVHRDVSPHNVFVTYSGDVKVLDFGIAKNAFQEGRTRTGLLKGKVAYMAPEQARGEAVDRRADLFSVGVMMWEVLTGSRLFKAANEAASLNLTLTAAIPKPSSLRPDVPRELDRIVRRALQRDWDQRYRTALEMRQDLEAWLVAQGRKPSPATTEHFMDELFADDAAKGRARLGGLLQGSMGSTESSPPSSSNLTSLAGPSSGTPTNLFAGSTTVSDVFVAFERRDRRTTRMLGAALVAVGALLVSLIWVVLNRSHGGPAANVEPAPAAPPIAAPKLAPAAPPATADLGAAAPAIVAANASAAQSPSEVVEIKEPMRVSHSVKPTHRRSDEPRPSAQSSAKSAEAEASRREHGFLTIDTSPWSLVSADGVPLGQTPLVGAKLSAGPHTLFLSNPELGLKTTYQVSIEPGKTTVRRIGLD